MWYYGNDVFYHDSDEFLVPARALVKEWEYHGKEFTRGKVTDKKGRQVRIEDREHIGPLIPLGHLLHQVANHAARWGRNEFVKQFGLEELLDSYDKPKTRGAKAIAKWRESKTSKKAPKRERTPRAVPLRLRYTILERDGGKCCLCGSKERLHVDHIVPYSKGGETVIENLRTLCADCNIGKGALMPSEAAA